MDNRQAAQGDLREELLRKQALAEERQELINACLREQEKLKAENDALKAEAERLQGELAARKRMIENYEAQLLRLVQRRGVTLGGAVVGDGLVVLRRQGIVVRLDYADLRVAVVHVFLVEIIVTGGAQPHSADQQCYTCYILCFHSIPNS